MLSENINILRHRVCGAGGGGGDIHTESTHKHIDIIIIIMNARILYNKNTCFLRIQTFSFTLCNKYI